MAEVRLARARGDDRIATYYLKLGVSSRARATLFATQHGLVGSFDAV